MKAWRVISLCLWGIFLCGCVAISLVYFVLDQSVLDQAKVTQQLQTQHFYRTIRSERVLPELYNKSASQLNGDNKLLKRQDIESSLEQVFTEAKVTDISNIALDVTYQWLDKKRPDLDFSIPISAEKQQLISTIAAKVDQNAAQLPNCSLAESLAFDATAVNCVPFFLTASALSSRANQVLDSAITQTDATITNEDLGLVPSNFGALANAPDYISYLWTLTLIALPLAILGSLYLLFKRRGWGVLVIGIVVLVNGFIATVGYFALNSRSIIGQSAALNSALTALVSVVQSTLVLCIIVGLGSGIVLIGLGVLWAKHSARRARSAHYVAAE